MPKKDHEYRCNICNKEYSTYNTLWVHNKKYHNLKNSNNKSNDKYKISKMISHDKSMISHEKNTEATYKCNYCSNTYRHFQSRWKHEQKCKKDLIVEDNKIIVDPKQQNNNQLINTQQNINQQINNDNKQINNQLIELIVEKTKTIEELKNKLDEKPIEISKEDIIIKSSTLTLNDVVIISRVEDNYINATQLCQAGGKKFNDWYRLDTTKELIILLESKAGIPALNLVEVNKGGIHLGSWIHPDLAIQLAQWISPLFALQVSSWIRTLLTCGTVSVDIKLKEKDLELKLKDEKIQLLKDNFAKKQKRDHYDDNLIYLLTTKENIKNRIYIFGKAKNLANRLSTYNKTCEHQIIYTKKCNTNKILKIAEDIILEKLDQFKEKANRDRFVLPIDKNISYFTNIINICVDQLNGISNIKI
jgi:hypothetical protein